MRFVVGPLAVFFLIAAFAPNPLWANRYAQTWLVRFDLANVPTDFGQRLQQQLEQAGITAKIKPIAMPAAWVLRLPTLVDEPFLRGILTALAPVRHLEPNLRWRPVATPNDPLFSQQWGLHNTGQSLNIPQDIADGFQSACDSNNDSFCDVDPGTSGIDVGMLQAWQKTKGASSGIKIRLAVIDSGIVKEHPDFNSANGSKIWRNSDNALAATPFASADYGWDACNGDGEPEDDLGHGTQVAGVIAADGDDGFGIAGVAWDVELVIIKFLGATSVHEDEHCGTTAAAIEALEFARLTSASVVNMSWGGAEASSLLEEKLLELAAENIVLVAAAGNEGQDFATAPFYPAAYSIDQMISVAAHTNDGQLASFSNYGGSVAIAAPGAAIATDNGAWDDLWAGANFANISGGASPQLLFGAIAGTNFSVDGSHSKWGKFGFVDGTKVLLGDLPAACPNYNNPLASDCGAQSAHSANIVSTLTADTIDAAAFGSAIFKYVLAYDLGPGSSLDLQYSTDGGANWNVVETASYSGYHSYYEYRIDFGSVLSPLPNSLKVRFVFETSAAHSGHSESPIYGGVQLFDVAWLKPSSNFSQATILSQGTSLAAPFVAGAAALVRDVFQHLDAAAVVRHLRTTAANGNFNDRVINNARLDIASAVLNDPENLIEQRPEPTTSPPPPTVQTLPDLGGGGCGCRAGGDLGGLAEMFITAALTGIGFILSRRCYSR